MVTGHSSEAAHLNRRPSIF